MCIRDRARTDYQYIEETLKRFYKVDRKIRYRAIYLGSKTKYNAKDKVREINKNIKTFIGETTVIYFIDVDDYDTSYDTKKLYEDVYKRQIVCRWLLLLCLNLPDQRFSAGQRQRFHCL